LPINVQRPIKAIVQSDGDVILGEFTDDDGIGLESLILNGSESEKDSLRSMLGVIKYTPFTNINYFDTLPENGRLGLDQNTGKLYVSSNQSWLEIGKATQASGTTTGGNAITDAEIEKFVFSGNTRLDYNSSTKVGTISIDLSGVTARLDIIEASDATPNSIRYLIDQGTSSINTRLDTIEASDATPNSIRYLVKQSVDSVLDGVSIDFDTLNETAAAITAIQTSVGAQNLSNVENNITVLQSEMAIARDDVLNAELEITSLSTAITNVNSNIGTNSAALNGFQYSGHNATLMNDPNINNLSVKWNSTTSKFEPAVLAIGNTNFIRFKKTNGTYDDIPLTTTFYGNVAASGSFKFIKTDGTRDDINLVASP
tara:strand:+ start:3641 stop:4753 length:1113 start_codon:yes stop_codon:yes gene_type:complete